MNFTHFFSVAIENLKLLLWLTLLTLDGHALILQNEGIETYL